MSNVIPFDYTFVLYDPEDPLAFVCAILSLVPQAIVLIYACQCFSRREVETFMQGAGQVLCEIANMYLKKILKQERPNTTFPLNDGFGMPSAHSQFVGFYATYICLWMWFRMRHFSTTRKALRSFGLLTLALSVAFSRVYLHYHSPDQVAVGLLAGAIFGASWLAFVVLLRDLGIIDLLLDLPPARYFYIKDTACEKGSFIREEYAEWRRNRMKFKLLVKVD